MSHRFLLLAACLSLLAAVPVCADDAEDQAVKAVDNLGGKVVRNQNGTAKPIIEPEFGSTEATDAGLRSWPPS